MFLLFFEGVLLGLSTGFFCLASCLPALLPWLLSGGSARWTVNLAVFAEFLAGRFLAYLLFAVFAVWVGKVSNPHLPPAAAPLAMLTSALAMLYYLFATRSSGGGCLTAGPVLRRIPLALGFMTGINICPPFIAAFVRLAVLGELIPGLAFFSGFFAATSAFLAPALLATPFMTVRLKQVGRMTLLLSAFWYLFLGIASLF